MVQDSSGFSKVSNVLSCVGAPLWFAAELKASSVIFLLAFLASPSIAIKAHCLFTLSWQQELIPFVSCS